MPISVKFFASLRELTGRGELRVDAPAPLDAKGLWQQVCPDIAMPAQVLVAINLEYASLDTPLEDGDEVAFFPPVTGG